MLIRVLWSARLLLFKPYAPPTEPVQVPQDKRTSGFDPLHRGSRMTAPKGAAQRCFRLVNVLQLRGMLGRAWSACVEGSPGHQRHHRTVTADVFSQLSFVCGCGIYGGQFVIIKAKSPRLKRSESSASLCPSSGFLHLAQRRSG